MKRTGRGILSKTIVFMVIMLAIIGPLEARGYSEGIDLVLTKSIQFELSDQRIIKLDNQIMKGWIKVYEEGNVKEFALDEGINLFVEELAKEAEKSSENIKFYATGIGYINLYVRPSKRDIIDKEATAELIKEILFSDNYSEEVVHPIYVQNIRSNFNKYIEIDITRQRVWFYENGECIVETPCVTGMAKKHDTPTGIYVIDAKQTNRTLRGRNDDGSKYASFVNYWMPFNGGVGLHDATWRNQKWGFGGSIYKTNGSHGCVNLPLSAAKTVFEHIDFGTWIVVYCS